MILEIDGGLPFQSRFALYVFTHMQGFFVPRKAFPDLKVRAFASNVNTEARFFVNTPCFCYKNMKEKI